VVALNFKKTPKHHIITMAWYLVSKQIKFFGTVIESISSTKIPP
jgi:hypothetical protein